MTDYTETTRKAVAMAFEWHGEPGIITDELLHMLDGMAAEAQGWVLDESVEMWLDVGCTIDDAGSIMGGLITYTPTTDAAQAIALCDAVGWASVGEVVAEIVGPKVLRPGWIDGVAFAMNNNSEDRTAILTAAAIIAARES